MTVPVTVRIGALVLVTTAFYGYVGQMVPQKEVQPPQEIAVASDLTTADMVTVGRQIMEGKGLCVTCHTIGKTGALRFPDLEGGRSPREDPGPGPERCRVLRPIDVRPDAYVVPGFPRRCPPSTSLRSASPIRRSSA
jgi:hypothetical protein